MSPINRAFHKTDRAVPRRREFHHGEGAHGLCPGRIDNKRRAKGDRAGTVVQMYGAVQNRETEGVKQLGDKAERRLVRLGRNLHYIEENVVWKPSRDVLRVWGRHDTRSIPSVDCWAYWDVEIFRLCPGCRCSDVKLRQKEQLLRVGPSRRVVRLVTNSSGHNTAKQPLFDEKGKSLSLTQPYNATLTSPAVCYVRAGEKIKENNATRRG
jgi:hypothetical protein